MDVDVDVEGFFFKEGRKGGRDGEDMSWGWGMGLDGGFYFKFIC